MLISLTNPRTLPSIFHCWRQWRHSTAPPAARGFVPRCASIGQLNRGSSQEYFADGMTEERIGRLSNIRGLRCRRVCNTRGKSDSCPGPVNSRRDRRGASPNGLAPTSTLNPEAHEDYLKGRTASTTEHPTR